MTTGTLIVIGIVQGAILGAVLFIAKKLIKDIPEQINRMKGGSTSAALTVIQCEVDSLLHEVEALHKELETHYLNQSLEIDYKVDEFVKVDGDLYKITQITKDEKKGRADEIVIEGIGVKIRQ